MMSPEELERIWNCELAACCWSIRLLGLEEQSRFLGIEYAAESQDDSAAQYFKFKFSICLFL